MATSLLDPLICTDSTPAISIALHSFVTAGILATSLAAAIFSVSSANLGVMGTLASESSNTVASDSMNLHVSKDLNCLADTISKRTDFDICNFVRLFLT